MKWTLRFVAFATLLAIPCFFLSKPWQHVLGRIASGLLGAFGLSIEMQEVQLMAPFDLGIYVAMCLASRRAPPLARRRALEWGIPLMTLLELVTIVVAILVYFALAKQPAGERAALRAAENLIEFVPWASATTVWLTMLGAWELPLARLGLAAPDESRGGPSR